MGRDQLKDWHAEEVCRVNTVKCVVVFLLFVIIMLVASSRLSDVVLTPGDPEHMGGTRDAPHLHFTPGFNYLLFVLERCVRACLSIGLCPSMQV